MCRHQNYDSMTIRTRDIVQIRFSLRQAILKNGQNPYHVPFFSGNIVNIIHRSPLIKMVPLVESSGAARGPILAHGLLPVAIINQDEHKNKL